MKPAARTEYIVACIKEGGSMYPDDAKAFLAEHDAEVIEGDAGKGFAAGLLTGIADTFITSCPDHGSGDTCFIACQCPAAEELQRMARAATAGPQAGDQR